MSAVLDFMTTWKYDGMVKIIQNAVDTLEKRAGISVRDYLGFGDIDDHTKIYSMREQYFGELDAPPAYTNFEGRGLHFMSKIIVIGYWSDGDQAPGNYIGMGSDGQFWVGEIYIDSNGNQAARGTNYKPNGTSNEYGK